MQPLIVNEALVLKDLKTDLDVQIVTKCDVYSKIETTGDLHVFADVTFHDTVQCTTVRVEGGTVHFLNDLHCNRLNTDVVLTVDGDLIIDDFVTGNGTGTKCRLLFVRGEPQPLPKLPEIPFYGSESTDIVCKEDTSVVLLGLCENCRQEKLVQTIHSKDQDHFSICFECVSELFFGQNQQDSRRVPTNWEIAHMSEEERHFFAENGYVTFEERVPSEPFICVRQESSDGDLVYKEIVVYDPQGRYLSEEDMEKNKRRLTYNGGPFAWFLQGTLSATSLYAVSAFIPVIGPAIATAGWLASLPLSWKLSKKLTNLINDKLVLPHELESRRELIESRRRDQRARQDVYIETL